MAKILVIEDTLEIQEMISLVLKVFGHEVIGVREKTEVKSLIIENDPQVVLLDVLLRRNLSGREICREIKALKPSLPVILMSADPKLLADYGSCGADDIIEKPFDITELKNKIEQFLA